MVRRLVTGILVICLCFCTIAPAFAAEELPSELRKIADKEDWQFVESTVTKQGVLHHVYRTSRGYAIVSQGYLDNLKAKTEDKVDQPIIRGWPHVFSHNAFLEALGWLGAYFTFRMLCTEVYSYVQTYQLKSGTMREPDEYGTIVCDIINGVCNWR